MLRFRLFGVPCEVTWLFWIGSAILGGNLAQGENGTLLLGVWVLCVLVSILAHELGHALAARNFGAQPRIALYQFGGVTAYPGGFLTRGQHILVSLAGPAAGFTAYLAVRTARYLLVDSGHDDLLYEPTQTALVLRNAVEFLLWINGVWTVFNLLPILPLDGGQVLRETLGPSRVAITRAVGGVCAVACCVAAVHYGQYFTAFFLGWMAYSNLMGDTRSFTGGARV